VAAIILVATWRLGHGSRLAAIALLALNLLAKLSTWAYGGESLWAGAIWSVILIGAFANGFWGTFALATIARESEALGRASSETAPDSDLIASQH
jgi:hypothetical protein